MWPEGTSGVSIAGEGAWLERVTHGAEGMGKPVEIDLKALAFQDVELGFCPGDNRRPVGGFNQEHGPIRLARWEGLPCSEHIWSQGSPGQGVEKSLPGEQRRQAPRELTSAGLVTRGRFARWVFQ